MPAYGMFAYGMAAYVAGALRRICVLGCLLLGMAWPAAALPATAVTTQATALPAAPLRDYLVDRWTTRHGLPHNSIRDIAQTPDGFLWFATWEGLVRYDGLEFTVFDRSTSQPALPDNGVGALYVDGDGALWSSDSRGNLGRRSPDGRDWTFWSGEGRWPQVLIHAMAKDADGRMWLLFEGHGLGCLHPDGRFEYFDAPGDVPLRLSYPKLAIGDDGRIWIGGIDGIVVRDPDGTFRRAPASFGLAAGLAWPYRAPDGAIWLVAGEGVHRVDGANAPRLHRVVGQGLLTALLQDRRGDLWVGSENRGVLRIGPRGVERPSPDEERPPGRIVNLIEDAEGSVWAGANGGLFRLRETLFTRWTRRHGLSGDYVRAVLEDDAGVLWIGSAGGLDRMPRGGTPRPVPLLDGIQPSVLSLAQTGNGDLWVGTYGGRVLQLRDGRVLHRYEGLAGHVRALAAADAASVWAATHRGPVRLTGGRVEPLAADGLADALVTALAVIDGALWIGSVDGAHEVRDGRVRRIALETLSGARSVFGFSAIGSDVWIATDRGLYRERAGALARVGLEHGLPVDSVFQLVGDRLGNAWISSNRGMLRARFDDLHAVADGRLARLPVDRYSEIDGMSNAQGNGSSGPSVIVRADGTVWMVTAGGLSVVDPQRWQGLRQRPPPVPRIESVRLAGGPVAWSDGVRVPGRTRISVSYIGLSFLMPERIRFRTRLDGLDDDWVEHGRQRSVDYVGLPPGAYTLRVSAAHAEGDWSMREARWQFVVEPLWWQRPWVRLAAVLAMALLLLAAYRIRMRRYRSANERLSRLVDERTSALQQRTEQLLRADSEKSELLSRLRSQAEAFERQAYEDALTGLPNRRSFDEALQREFARARRKRQPLCVLTLDVDHFKAINDAHTHAGGDAVLREMGALLVDTLRASDMAARIGGEEFAVLLVDGTLDDAAALHARLRARLAARSDWGGLSGLRVTVSAGASMLEPRDASPADVYRRADEALYRAKSAGRDRIHMA